jgi:outer membrane murein-binding lipoprotein Lpp
VSNIRQSRDYTLSQVKDLNAKLSQAQNKIGRGREEVQQVKRKEINREEPDAGKNTRSKGKGKEVKDDKEGLTGNVKWEVRESQIQRTARDR